MKAGVGSSKVPGKAMDQDADVDPMKEHSQMQEAVSAIVHHNKLMEDQPDMYKKASEHVKKHGHRKAMEMLKKPKHAIKSLDDLKKHASQIMEGEG